MVEVDNEQLNVLMDACKQEYPDIDHGRPPAHQNDHSNIFSNNFFNFYNILNIII